MSFAIVAITCLSLAAVVSVGNWIGVIAWMRDRRRGNTRSFSIVPVVTLVLVVVAALANPLADPGRISTCIFWFVALTDLALWQLLYLPIFLFRNRHKGQTYQFVQAETASRLGLSGSVYHSAVPRRGPA